MLTVVIAGCIVVLACGTILMWASSKMRSEIRAQLGSLSADVRTLQRDAADRITPVDTTRAQEIPKIEIAAAKADHTISVLLPTSQRSTAVSPETHVMIKGVLSTLLGHEVRIRSVELLDTPDAAMSWATQGRVAIQASHNQRTNRG